MKYLMLLLCLFAFGCSVRRPIADVNKEATCTAKCYDLLCVGHQVKEGRVSLDSSCDEQYIVGKFIGTTPEDYLVCECMERTAVFINDKTELKLKRKFVIERKPDNSK